MITVLLVNIYTENIIRRYDTNSFDDALKQTANVLFTLYLCVSSSKTVNWRQLNER